jgi:hypothetical protein
MEPTMQTATGASPARIRDHRPWSSPPGTHLVAAIIAALAVTSGAQGPANLDRLFADFWKAEDARSAERAGERIAKADPDFDALYARLKAGRV